MLHCYSEYIDNEETSEQRGLRILREIIDTVRTTNDKSCWNDIQDMNVIPDVLVWLLSTKPFDENMKIALAFILSDTTLSDLEDCHVYLVLHGINIDFSLLAMFCKIV